MARDRFRTLYGMIEDEEPSAPYRGPHLYDTYGAVAPTVGNGIALEYDRANPLPGQPGYGVVLDAPGRVDRARDAEFQAQHEAMSPAAREMNRRMREARHAEEDLGYSPIAMGTNAVPFSDEILGLASSIGSDAPSYEEAQRAWSDARSAQSAAYPLSAAIGSAGQLALTAPIPLVGEVNELSLPGIARAVAPTAAVGTGGGLAAGALTSRPGHRVEDTLTGGAVGLGLGTLAGTGLAAGQALRMYGSLPTTSMGRAAAARLLAGPAEGLGYAAALTPDMMPNRFRDVDDAYDTLSYAAPLGMAFGTGFGAAGEMRAALPRGRAMLSEQINAARDRLGNRYPDVTTPAPEIDETLAQVSDLPGISIDGIDDVVTPRDTTPIVEVGDQAARNAMAQDENVSLIDRILQTGLTSDVNANRLQSIGMTQQQMRRSAAPFGGEPGLVRSAQEFGVLRPGSVYDPSTEIARIRSILGETGNRVNQVYRQIGESGATVSGDVPAEYLREQARIAGRLVQGEERANVLEDLAERYRTGGRVDPATAWAEPSREYTMPELLEQLRGIPGTNNAGARGRARNAFEQPRGQVTERQAAALDEYSALRHARDRLTESELRLSEDDPGAFPQLQRDQRGFQTMTALNGQDPTVGMDARQWGQARAWAGALAGARAGQDAAGIAGILPGAALGFTGARALSRMQPSIMATINETGFSSLPNTLANAASATLRSIESGGGAAFADPAQAAAFRAQIDGALSLARSDPEAAAAAFERAISGVRRTAPEAAPAIDRAAAPLLAQRQWPDALRRIEQIARTDPARLRALGDEFSQAYARGTLGALVYVMARHNPQAFARLQSEITQETESAMPVEIAAHQREIDDEFARNLADQFPIDSDEAAQPEATSEPSEEDADFMRQIEERFPTGRRSPAPR